LSSSFGGSCFLWSRNLLLGNSSLGLWFGSGRLLEVWGELVGVLELDEVAIGNTCFECHQERVVDPLLVLGHFGLHQLLDCNGR
jgi:hypothetical protein